MFTGIIEEVGYVARVRTVGQTQVLVIGCHKVLEGTKLGDSIAVNGVCLTVTKMDHGFFYADVMPETYQRTCLQFLRSDDPVHLERAVALGDRMGGHFVQGHVDGIAKLIKKQPAENAVLFQFEIEPSWTKFMIPKGSIAINGTSLTLVEVTDTTFSVSLIPHTMRETQFGSLVTGDRVNIECDMMAKYIAKWTGVYSEPTITSDGVQLTTLQRTGFL
ncbi:riboflavin synthase [Thermoactinomyces sp. DSM 45892]|uniref:riboflavin synthase n=1 Tax=Thermoactinomyces sp. DSM 45892 TaxID=1882753 RepID=UPI0008958AE5|nr:riboflavin synthase [Thermoactinomyces sp. DSM 45892]SDZ08989.1 riboflavin synthase alpha chain [Thermoactinomyces sp. DSM 45892]